MPRIDSPSTSLDPARVTAELDRAQAVLTRADDAPKDGYVRGTRFGNEMAGVSDELAKAIFDYVDFVSYRGQLSVYGTPGRGDYLEGGLGMGYTLRPKHMTDNKIVSLEDIGRGVGEIRDRLTGRVQQNDSPNQDVAKIAERAIAAGFGKSGEPGAVYGEIWSAVDRLLNRVSELTGSKERKVGKEVAPLTHEELLQGIEPQSLEFLIADEVLRGAQEKDGQREHWMGFFSRAVREVEMRRQAFRLERTPEAGLVGDTLQQYLLVVGKRAQETEILTRVEHAIAEGVK
jgi:hypothetical protein